MPLDLGHLITFLLVLFFQVSKEAVSSWCKEKDIAYFEVSAKNDINVVQAFETLARQALSRVRGRAT